MADTVKRTVPIWVFGTKTDFKIYDCGTALNAFQFRQDGGSPARRQKNQICLHFTAGNGPGQGTVDWWNTEATQFFCPKWPTHDFQSPNPGVCPEGHGTLQHMNASAHYVVERARDRAEAGRAYVDVIEVVESDYVTWHGESVNTNSIGIEHANVGPAFNLTNDDTFTGAGANRRPTDGNHWLSMPHYAYSGSNLSSHAFQAYQEEQYLAMILLLRYLCLKHRIARRFLGDTTTEKFARWHNRGTLVRSRLMRFRGIFAHMNCHNTKECGGPALHRNRLFRGIIDEWWLPIEVEGTEREYYMGPFDPQPNTPSFYRWSGGALTAALFRDCNVDALQETKSYFLLDRVDWYYAQTEIITVGGFFPIGTNRIWHGGVHFQPKDANRKIYAACSGTIVAARLGSDAALEADKEYGSQRFVLIRHCVYWQQEPDPGGGQRTNYSVDPTYFFTLYMHLAPVAKMDGADDNNPPWFNYWLRRNAGGNANPVFCPNVPVSVGDWIGDCGVYRTQRMLHFEVVSKEEMTDAPWNDPAYRIYDADSNAICNVPELNHVGYFARGERPEKGQNISQK
jgi:N-acetylmuramoyl-L-alanine amidase